MNTDSALPRVVSINRRTFDVKIRNGKRRACNSHLGFPSWILQSKPGLAALVHVGLLLTVINARSQCGSYNGTPIVTYLGCAFNGSGQVIGRNFTIGVPLLSYERCGAALPPSLFAKAVNTSTGYSIQCWFCGCDYIPPGGGAFGVLTQAFTLSDTHFTTGDPVRIDTWGNPGDSNGDVPCVLNATSFIYPPCLFHLDFDLVLGAPTIGSSSNEGLVRLWGIPGSSYAFEAAPTPLGPWSLSSINTADSAGFAYLAVSSASANQAMFFRAGYDWTRQWVQRSAVGAPSPRGSYSAVWTGNEMIIYGGYNNGYVNSGGRYNPTTDTWGPLSTNGAPPALYYHTAVWTGTEMILWGGGNASGRLNTGWRYSPVADSWSAISTNGAPTARDEVFDAIWTGSEMIIWGGWNGAPLNTGARYNPTTDTWIPITTNGAPSARNSFTAVWTGTEMLVWGGSDTSSALNTGARYNPLADTWTTITTSNAPAARFLNSSVWTGAELIVWGGKSTPSIPLASGGRYNPITDIWRSIQTNGAPIARWDRPLRALWTGKDMIVWGGFDGNGHALNSGGRYDPAADIWQGTSTDFGPPEPRGDISPVWTGHSMLVFFGVDEENNRFYTNTFLYTTP